ncbi:uncharacterized protein [Littorina saxatilis]|uniref:uncharacterized protein n=1 Tax=Littorina saxatilis TaxID=31220 RepID=UPI0038B48E64
MHAENPIEEVDFKSSVNQRADQNLDIGEDARTMIENKKDHHLRDSRIKEIYSNVRQYYTTLMDYLLSHLPETKAPQMTEDDFDPRRLPFLAQLEIVDVEKQSAGYFSTLRHLVKTYPVLLPPGCHLDVLNLQFGVYQMPDMTQYKADRLDQTWANIGQDPILKLTELSLVMRGLLVIPHSSAHCERVFSCVRKVNTPQRSSLSLKTLESLLVLKNCDTEAVQNLPEDAIMPLKQAYSKKVHASKKL